MPPATSHPGLVLIASSTFTRDDRTLLGSTPEEVAAAAAAALGVDAIGVNCGEGPAQVLRVVRAMGPVARAASIPLLARPNAGGPAEVGGRLLYPATPEYVGEIARAMLDEGVALLGGCCGTGPAHTAAIATAIAAATSGPAVRDRDPVAVHEGHTAELVRLEPAAPPTELQARLAAGGFVVTVEMEPPRSFNAAELVAAAQTLADAGADAIDVADSPMAKMRMSAWAACRLVQENVGIGTVLHFPTRGRNLLRLQGDLLGAHALGIRNLFVCLGDPVTIGDYPHGGDNVDVTATGLAGAHHRSVQHGGRPSRHVHRHADVVLRRRCRLPERPRPGARGDGCSNARWTPARASSYPSPSTRWRRSWPCGRPTRRSPARRSRSR